jgi:hypothetical protein
VHLKTNRGHINITGVCAPEEIREEETRPFYKQLQKEVDKYSKSDRVLELETSEYQMLEKIA